MLRYLRKRARLRSVMSAFGGKADIAQTCGNDPKRKGFRNSAGSFDIANQASYVRLVANVHRSFLDAPDRRASIIDSESAGSMCDMPQARHSKVWRSGRSSNRDVIRASRII